MRRWASAGLGVWVAACGLQRPTPAPPDGVRGRIDYRHVALGALSLRLSIEDRCRPALPRHADQRCRVRPFRGTLSLTLEPQPSGVALPGDLALPADADGRVRIDFFELDERLREAGVSRGLDAARSIRLGSDGWAGTVDLVRLREYRAQWHLAWIRQGRGAPGLFAHVHPEHPALNHSTELATEARLARRRDDRNAVRAGRLAPETFERRHLWSPPLLLGPKSPSPPDAMRPPSSRAASPGVENINVTDDLACGTRRVQNAHTAPGCSANPIWHDSVR